MSVKASQQTCLGNSVLPADAGVGQPCLHVAVADTGIGIHPTDHERIFLEFEQVIHRMDENRERDWACIDETTGGDASRACLGGERRGRAPGSIFRFFIRWVEHMERQAERAPSNESGPR